MAPHRTRRGLIRYLSLQPHRYLEDRGRERFHMTFRPDGSRTLNAVCEIDDTPSVLRHVTMTYGADGYPTDALVKIDVEGEPVGFGAIDLTARSAILNGRNAKAGRISAALELEAPLSFVGCDPIVSDAWHMAHYDLSKGPGRQWSRGVLSSADHRGGTGPTLWLLTTGMEFVGPERLTVQAGTFDSLHFRIVDTAGQMQEEHPPYDLWTTADGDYIALRSEGSERRYELAELTDGW